MTAKRSFKRRIRARAARTGESYTAALRHFPTEGATVQSTYPSLVLAIAQTTPRHDPGDPAAFREQGAELRALIRAAARAGARLVQFPEGALCFPSKVALSPTADPIGPSDWSRYAWDAQRAELDAIRSAAATERIRVVVGVPHASPRRGERPTASLLVIDERGRDMARYDERMLSRTKRDLMYRAGGSPLLLDLDGIRVGLLSGLEGLFPELFAEYESTGADLVLYSTAGPGPADGRGTLASAAASAAHVYGLSVGYSVPTDNGPEAPAGFLDPAGAWTERCTSTEPGFVLAHVGPRPESAGREWHRAMSVAHREPASAD